MCFFFNDTATTEIYTLSLHDALPIFGAADLLDVGDRGHPLHQGAVALLGLADLLLGLLALRDVAHDSGKQDLALLPQRSEEHTSELQSRQYLVCRLLLEKKKPVSLLI